MKIRALLLLALMIGGAYVMFQTNQSNKPKAFADILSETEAPFNSLTFNKPAENESTMESWIVDEPAEIEMLLSFLQNYHVRKVPPEDINLYDNVNYFSIQLHDENGRELSIIVNENLIIQDELLYYEVIDGPLDVNWLLTFFINNQ